MLAMLERYLGDGVRVSHDGYHAVLTVPATASASGVEQRISLDPEVQARLARYLAEIVELARAQGTPG